MLVILIDITYEDCNALKEKNWSKVKLYTYELKSSFSYLLLYELIELCDLIKANRSNSIENIEPLVLKIFTIYEELVSEIKIIQN